MKWFGEGASEQMDIALRGGFEVYGQTAVNLRKKTELFDVYIKTALDDEVLDITGLKRFGRAEDILDIIRPLDNPETVVIPESGTFCFQAP